MNEQVVAHAAAETEKVAWLRALNMQERSRLIESACEAAGPQGPPHNVGFSRGCQRSTRGEAGQIGLAEVNVQNLSRLKIKEQVPIRADGSAFFTVPALKSVSFDVLDAQGKMLARMGSDMHLMPGEHRGCIGCHENRQQPGGPQRSEVLPPCFPLPPGTEVAKMNMTLELEHRPSTGRLDLCESF